MRVLRDRMMIKSEPKATLAWKMATASVGLHSSNLAKPQSESQKMNVTITVMMIICLIVNE